MVDGTGIQQAYFADHELNQAWQAAATPNNTTGYRDAVTQLARRRDELDAPVFVRIPGGDAADENWRIVRSSTRRLCTCGERRLLVPAKMSEAFAPGAGDLHTVTAAKALTLAPWGGDRHAAWLALRRRGVNLSKVYTPPVPIFRLTEKVYGINDLRRALKQIGPISFVADLDGVEFPMAQLTDATLLGLRFAVHSKVRVVPPISDVEPVHVCPAY